MLYIPSLLHHNSSALVLFWAFNASVKNGKSYRKVNDDRFWWTLPLNALNVLPFYTNLRAVVFIDHHRYLVYLNLKPLQSEILCQPLLLLFMLNKTSFLFFHMQLSNQRWCNYCRCYASSLMSEDEYMNYSSRKQSSD